MRTSPAPFADDPIYTCSLVLGATARSLVAARVAVAAERNPRRVQHFITFHSFHRVLGGAFISASLAAKSRATPTIRNSNGPPPLLVNTFVWFNRTGMASPL